MVSNITYEEKLKKLNLTTLDERRWRGDMIQAWRFMTGKERFNVETMYWVLAGLACTHRISVCKLGSIVSRIQNTHLAGLPVFLLASPLC